MAKLINRTEPLSDNWRLLDAAAPLTDILASGDVIVPLALWRAHRDALAARNGRTGVWLAADEGPDALAEDIDRLPLIAVSFPKFGDGRGFSTARLLRERYGYKGELRAIGDVLRDQLFFMERCGFDTFALRDDQDVVSALAAFADFTDAYHTSVAQPVPLFRRRLTAS
jgi:uncharacterized protein (DUF934 family)